jgi:hypothetical protein
MSLLYTVYWLFGCFRLQIQIIKSTMIGLGSHMLKLINIKPRHFFSVTIHMKVKQALFYRLNSYIKDGIADSPACLAPFCISPTKIKAS